MIIGIGIDIIEISRIEEAISRNSEFKNRFFSNDEIEYFNKKNNRAEVIAGNFAAKEAFCKAIGTGIKGVILKDVEVLRDDNGKPYIKLTGNMSKILSEKCINKLHVSISHCKEYATANVIAEGGIII